MNTTDLHMKITDFKLSQGRDLKESSTKMYIGNIMKLSRHLNEGKLVDGYEWLMDIEEVKKKLEDKGLAMTSIRNFMNTAILYLQINDAGKDIIDKYMMYRDELNSKYEEIATSGKFSESQSKAYISMEELHKFIESIAKDLKSFKLKDKLKTNQPLTNREKHLLQIYLVLNIHAEVPMRNDLAGTRVVKKDVFDKMSQEQQKKGNYLVYNRLNMFLYLNDYKTDKVYKSKKIDLSKDLRKVVNFYLKFNEGSEYLLTKLDGEPKSKNNLTQDLRNESLKRLNKAISTTMLRKIYLTDKYSDLKNELKKDNDNMMHSMKTALTHYVKDKPDQDSVSDNNDEAK